MRTETGLRTTARLLARAVRSFDDVDLAERWLKTPHRLLQGRTPMQAVETLEGATAVERQLRWYAAGRAAAAGAGD